MNDIRQKTNNSGDDGIWSDTVHGHTIDYKIFNLTTSGTTERIIKLGYCCEPCGIGIPIYIF